MIRRLILSSLKTHLKFFSSNHIWLDIKDGILHQILQCIFSYFFPTLTIKVTSKRRSDGHDNFTCKEVKKKKNCINFDLKKSYLYVHTYYSSSQWCNVVVVLHFVIFGRKLVKIYSVKITSLILFSRIKIIIKCKTSEQPAFVQGWGVVLRYCFPL